MTTKIIMKRLHSGLIPADDFEWDKLAKIPHGKELLVELKQPRHPRHHRLFFALLTLAVENADDFATTDALLTWLKIKLGYVETMIWESGETVFVPKSISFASMDQVAFREFFDRALDAIVARYGWDRPGLVREIEASTGLRWTVDEAA